MAFTSLSGSSAKPWITGAIGPAATPWRGEYPVRKYWNSSSAVQARAPVASWFSAGAVQPSASPPAR